MSQSRFATASLFAFVSAMAIGCGSSGGGGGTLACDDAGTCPTGYYCNGSGACLLLSDGGAGVGGSSSGGSSFGGSAGTPTGGYGGSFGGASGAATGGYAGEIGGYGGEAGTPSGGYGGSTGGYGGSTGGYGGSTGGSGGSTGGTGGGSNSCYGYCGTSAPSGCYCDSACASYGDCCPDKSTYCP